MTEREAFYARLQKTLEETKTFPADYMFKFIFSTDSEKLSLLRALFKGLDPRLSTQVSRKGRYTSVTLVICAPNAALIIEKYREAERIEGLIAL